VSRIHLLDVNVLVALFDPAHVHHDLAHDWFADHRQDGWATCPLTENGVVRIITHPSYESGLRTTDMLQHLRRFRSNKDHVFWPDALSLADNERFKSGALAGARQITDVYLLGLAVEHDGALATFDRTIPIRAVVGARVEHLQVISAV
jgi:toxin-antitoxin system PIN domain toxin